jgi:shikimate kinase
MLIGLVGLKGSGKDTFAKTLIEEYGFIKDSFAAPLKDSVASIFGWDRDLVEGASSESRAWREEKDEYWSEVLNTKVTPRGILQIIGTEVFRDNLHEDIWVKSFIKRNQNSKNNIIMTDVRFPNEMQAIKDLGGIIIYVRRDTPTWLERLLEAEELYTSNDVYGTKEISLEDFYNECEEFNQSEYGSINYTIETLPHASERAWVERRDLIDYIVDNVGTLEDLHRKAEDTIKDLKVKS